MTEPSRAMDFGRAVQEAQDWFQTTFRDAPAEIREALAKPMVRDHAAYVDECVRRFSRAELDGKTVGRYGPVKLFASLGDYQAKYIQSTDASQSERVREAIALGVAIGYTFMAGIEEGVTPPLDRSSEEIWNVWAPNLNSGSVEQTALPPDMLSDVRQFGAKAFHERALRLDMGGFRKKGRLRRSGAFYAQAGVLLRALQVHQGDLQPDPANIWPYNEHPA